MRTIPTMPLWRFTIRRCNLGHYQCFCISIERGGEVKAVFYTDKGHGTVEYGIDYLRRCARFEIRLMRNNRLA